ncbi:hypothetical protein F511_10686 [Dorcoceras hygrometricum]|uniref:Uncharacterized protein n=1 Tax=Dorcoceras hygrometricum TaxID=472368 RepID=A0A2Z7CMJ2_9LAMI|nr:hypothetical protein F511_10686 [Dorcoceras hygrometricum]
MPSNTHECNAWFKNTVCQIASPKIIGSWDPRDYDLGPTTYSPIRGDVLHLDPKTLKQLHSSLTVLLLLAEDVQKSFQSVSFSYVFGCDAGSLMILNSLVLTLAHPTALALTDSVPSSSEELGYLLLSPTHEIAHNNYHSYRSQRQTSSPIGQLTQDEQLLLNQFFAISFPLSGSCPTAQHVVPNLDTLSRLMRKLPKLNPAYSSLLS